MKLDMRTVVLRYCKRMLFYCFKLLIRMFCCCLYRLSGGAFLGYYHGGVLKALFEGGYLPRVISGASAGSILASVVG
jgi:hypothetical protein